MALKRAVLCTVNFSGLILALLGPVDGGPEKGRIVYGKFLGAAWTATGEVWRAASG
jgi:hypothetical protein